MSYTYEDYKIHRLEHDKGASFFLIRPWGNYHFFPNPNIDLHSSFFKGHGGVFKQVYCDPKDILPPKAKFLFDRFGANVILPEEFHNPKIQEYPIEYLSCFGSYDDKIKWFKFGPSQYWILLKSKEKTFLFSQETLKISFFGSISMNSKVIRPTPEVLDHLASFNFEVDFLVTSFAGQGKPFPMKKGAFKKFIIKAISHF